MRIFAILGITLAAIAATWPLLLAFFPRLGAHHFYRLQRRRNLLAAAALLTAIADVRRTGRRLPLLATSFFAALAQILKPERIFVSLDTPVTVPADEATLADNELVIGIEIDGIPRAWPLRDMVISHHLVNDYVGDTPLLVGY